MIGLLLLLPWVLAAYGRGPAVLFVAAVLLAFAVLRAVAETAVYPWTQEFVPYRVRGRYSAVSSVACTLAAMGALAVAGYVIAHGSGMGRFVWLQGAGCVAGLIGTAFLLRVPGGAAAPPTLPHRPHWDELRDALRDANFRRFLFGTAGLSVGGGMVTAFMPLLLVERVGVQPGTVIWLDTAAMIGAIVVSLPCGWMADRFGSRTVLMPGLTMGLTISCFWLVVLALGKTALLGIPALALLGLLTGIANNAIMLGSGRLLLAGGLLTDVTAAGRSRA